MGAAATRPAIMLWASGFTTSAMASHLTLVGNQLDGLARARIRMQVLRFAGGYNGADSANQRDHDRKRERRRQPDGED